jgi:4-amino-4-deoxy-L-arabinose transferase-like glycosyltransferase
VKTVATFCGIAVLYLAVGVFDHEVWSPTEPTVAGIVWNMVAHGDLAVPRINDIAYLEKPPLYYWLAWGAAKVAGGLNAGTLRLPAALLGVLCLALLYAPVRRRHGEDVACATLLLAATSGAFYEIAHRASTDMAAVFFAFLCFALFARTLPVDDETPAPRALLWDVSLAAALAISFYAKNFFTFLIVLPPIAVHQLIERRFRRILVLAGLTALFTVALVTPWALALGRAGGDEYLRVVFFDNTVGRFFTIENYGAFEPRPLSDAFTAEKGESPFFYLARLPVLALPWILVFGVACVALARRARPIGSYARFLAIGFATVPLVLSLSSSKVSEYLLPAFFFVPLISAEFLGELRETGRGMSPWERRLVLINLVAVGALAAVAPLILSPLRHAAWILALALPTLGAAALLVARYRKRGLDAPWLLAYGGFVALAAALALALAIPLLEARKSYGPFFESARREMAGRPVVTTFFGDHGLPLITYYLERRVPVVSLEEVFARLQADAPVAALVSVDEYERYRERFDAVPGVTENALRGGNRIVYVANGRPLEDQNAVPSSM